MSPFEIRRVVLPPVADCAYDPASWRDALVVIEAGVIELVWVSGSRSRFRRRDLIWLDGLQLHALCNPGPEPAVLVAISRPPTRPVRLAL